MLREDYSYYLPDGKLYIISATPFISIELFRALAERSNFYLSETVITQIKNEQPSAQTQSWTLQPQIVYTYDLNNNMREHNAQMLCELSLNRTVLLETMNDDVINIEQGESTLLNSQCKVCYDNYTCVVFTGCGHAVCCYKCLHRLNDCPVCRSEVKMSEIAPLITSEQIYEPQLLQPAPGQHQIVLLNIPHHKRHVNNYILYQY